MEKEVQDVRVVYAHKLESPKSEKGSKLSQTINGDDSKKSGMSVRQIKSLLGISPTNKNKDFRVVISYEMASILLQKTNVKNRPISSSKIGLYLKDMKNDHWSNTSVDAIAFDKDGVLVNGQHRLHALVRSGKSFEFLVSFDVVPFMGMDTGKTRRISDNAIMFDDCDARFKDKTYKKCLDVIKSVVRFNTGKYVFGNTLTADDYILVANKYADDLVMLMDEGLFSSIKVSCGNGKGRVITSSAVFSAFFLAYENGVSLDVLLHIKEKLKDPSNSSSFDKPILALRDVLLSTVGGGREPDCTRHFCTQYCINAVANKSRGKSCKSTDAYYILDLGIK